MCPMGELHFWWLNSIQSITVFSRIATRRQKFLEEACLGIKLHRIPSLTLLSYGHGYPVQFPLQGDIRPFRQTGHATERNNYGTVAQFPDLAIKRSPAWPFSTFLPFSIFKSYEPTRDAKPFSFHTLQVPGCKCICAMFKSVNLFDMSLLAGSVTINHVVGIKTTFSFFVS